MEQVANRNDSNVEKKYIRIGTSLYRYVSKPFLTSKDEMMLVSWNLDTIKMDHPNNWKEIIKDIEKYDGFCTIPTHQNYVREFKGHYNLYEPMACQPAEGECNTFKSFIKHIFEEHYELGLDYLQLLYTKPLQRLPVLCLVSENRDTGKTTFLNVLKAIYGNNMTYNTNENFRSNFNSDWVSKLIIGIDEVLLDKKEDSERIKNLSTAKTYKAEAKGKDRFEVDFFGKIILCSNNETKFMVIGLKETRYWVRKIKQLQFKDPKYEDKLITEIPQILNFLLTRKLSTNDNSRMWFTEEQIYTEALRRVKSEYVNKIELELYEIIKEIMEIKELDTFSFINLNVKTLLEHSGHRVSRAKIRNILEERWGLTQYKYGSNFQTYQYDHSGFMYELEAKGRYYTIKSDQLPDILCRLST
jgi:hypothetical protein